MLRQVMTRQTVLCMSVALLSACGKISPPPQHELTSFKVDVTGIYQQVVTDAGTVRLPLNVVTACARRYGPASEDGGTLPDQTAVPAEVRGTEACRYVIPRGDIELDVDVVAVNNRGGEMPGAQNPISFRVIPGDLAGGYADRTTQLSGGRASAIVRAAHTYGQVRVWAEDGPPQPVRNVDGIEPAPAEPPVRSFATGLSRALFFEDPTIQSVQIPDGLDNRTSPFVGQFLTIGKSPQAGGPLFQTCPDDPENDGQPSLLVVTGADTQGFFVTDVTACRTRELLSDGTSTIRTAEPSGFYPGRFASLYIYNYSYPEGLFTGDALWTVSGAVQEFTSTTQLTFPAWSIAERVRERPQSQWNYYIDRVPPTDLSLRHCGMDDDDVTFLTDGLCGHNRRNLKMESLESGLVRVQHVRFPEKFISCDMNGDKSVPFYCETKTAEQDELGRDIWVWGDCNFEAPSTCQNEKSEACERQCNIDCSNGTGAHAGTRCSERTTYDGFGQYVVELAGPGPAAAGLDPSLPKRILTLPVSATPRNTSALKGGNLRFDFQRFDLGSEVQIWCDAPVRIAFGDPNVVPTDDSPALAANTLLRHTMGMEETHVGVLANGDFTSTSSCKLSVNMKTRMNLLTKDAVPDLEPDCDEADTDAEKARQCVLTHAASYDVVGHLRHLQPGRPRWAILPRDADDMCCHPGPGLECPKPLKACQ